VSKWQLGHQHYERSDKMQQKHSSNLVKHLIYTHLSVHSERNQYFWVTCKVMQKCFLTLWDLFGLANHLLPFSVQ